MKLFALRTAQTHALLILAFIISGIISPVQSETKDRASIKTVVYCFHGQYRCSACTRIEKLTRMSLQSGFAKELANGEIVFQPINIDIPKNEHYINDYRLTTRSVVVSKVKGGKEIAWKNLDRVWDYLLPGDEKDFLNYIVSEVKGFIR